jgi:hypothetical protein
VLACPASRTTLQRIAGENGDLSAILAARESGSASLAAIFACPDRPVAFCVQGIFHICKSLHLDGASTT